MDLPDLRSPRSGLSPEGLLAVAAGGWGYAEAEWIEGWHVRASGGFTNRANSAWPVWPATAAHEPVPRDLARTLAAVHAWYAERGLPAQVNCVIGSELDRAVEALGHGRTTHSALRQSGRAATILESLARSGPAGTEAATCALTDRPNAGWLGTYRSGTLPAVAGQVLGAGRDDIRFAAIADERDGSTLAIGRVALASAPGGAGPAGWAGIAAVETAPTARRRGLAKVVIRELIRWAAEHGTTDVYLEVSADNTAALVLYDSLGFTTHHAYHYRVIESIAD